MNIKDLPQAEEISREEQAAVSGGSVANANLGVIAIGPVVQAGNAGFAAFSPVANTNVQAPTLNQTNVGLDNDTAVLVGSLVGAFSQ